MLNRIKKYDLELILIVFLIGLGFLIMSWFCFIALRNFLLFLASISIAASPYIILILNSIKQRNRKEKRRIKELQRKKERKVKRFTQGYEKIRKLIIDVRNRAVEKEVSSNRGNSGQDMWLGRQILDLSYEKKLLNRLDCKVIRHGLVFAEDYIIDGYNAQIKYKEENIHEDQEKITSLLDNLEHTFRTAKEKIK
jgi:hypothetical protein